METATFEGQLEIDSSRGVIYFHSYDGSRTVLRMCGLPKPVAVPIPADVNGGMLDIAIKDCVVSYMGDSSK